MSELLDCCTWFLSSTWVFFTDITLPGTELTLAALFTGLLFISIAFRLLSLILGFNVGTPSDSYGSRRSKNVKISDKRKHDDK